MKWLKRLLRRPAPGGARYAAVDIGSREMKAIEICMVDGLPVATAYGRLPTPVNALDEPVDEEALVDALHEVVLSSGIQSKEVFSTISGGRVITRHIQVPPMPEKELENAIRYEAEKFIPIPIDELTVKYLILGESDSGGVKNTHVLLAALPTSLIYDYYRIFTRAGLCLAAIDLQALGLWRVFSGLNAEGKLIGTVGILDIGATTTQLLVVHDRELLYTRALPVGGNLLTTSLSAHYQYTFEEAQLVKEMNGVLLISKEAAALADQNAMRMDFSLRDGLSELVREIRRSLDYYASQQNSVPIERVIVSGGTSKLKGFREFFAEVMGVPVDFGSTVMAGLPGVKEMSPSFDPAFAVVAGTALREVAG